MGRPPRADYPPEFLELLTVVGENVRQARMRRGLTQAELARRAGISPATLNEIESRPARNVRLWTLYVVASCLGIRTEALFATPGMDLSESDRQHLLEASETIARISRKFPKDPDSSS